MPSPNRLLLPFHEGRLAVPSGPSLFLRAEYDPDLKLFENGLDCVQTYRPDYDLLAQSGLSMPDTPAPSYDLTLVSHTRHKAETKGLIASAMAHTRTGGTVVLSGSKTDGIDSTRKALGKLVEIDGVLPKSHGKVLWWTKKDVPAEFALWAQEAAPRPNSDQFMTAPGMFGFARIDAGSKFLAEQFGPRISGIVTDLGAGWGYLAHQALEASPKIAELHLIEAERNALDCATQNISDPRARFTWADVTKPNAAPKSDWVIMNPPFHNDRKANIDLGRAFIVATAQALKPKGTALMVANRHLAYEKTLQAAFGRVEQVAENPSFKVIRASKPKKM